MNKIGYKKNKKIDAKFVDTIPEELEDDVIYVSLLHKTVMHKCLCGCGEEISTPLHPTGWEITYNGDTISLWPSVGNWSLHCKSHYIIRKNTVIWCREWTREEIERERKRRKGEILDFYTDGDGTTADIDSRLTKDDIVTESKHGIFVKIWELLVKAGKNFIKSDH